MRLVPDNSADPGRPSSHSSRRVEGAAAVVAGGVHGVPRCHDREHRLSGDRANIHRHLAPVGGDEQVVLAGQGEVERGGDVLVGGAVGHRDRPAEQAELVVGADEADELNLALLGPAGVVRLLGRRFQGASGQGVAPA